MGIFRFIRTHYIFFVLFVFIVAWVSLLFTVGPDRIVEYIGTDNSYLITFVLSVVAGLSSLTGSLHSTALVTFAAGGAAPFLLGLVGGVGLFISDSIFFFVSHFGRHAVYDRWKKWIDRLTRWTREIPLWAVYLGIVVYLGALALPNDLLMLALAFGGYRYMQIMPAILAGSIAHAMVLAYFGEYFLDLLGRYWG